MHEVAILINDDPKLGKTGSLVTIDAVEKVYNSSAAAKVNRYKCANEDCGVNVIAIIPQKNKPGRKKSPCAYFSAKPLSHVDECSRQPLETEAKNTHSNTHSEANSTRRTAPTIWIDPTSEPKTNTIGDNEDEQKGESQSSASRSQTRGHGGVSEARSQLVKRFAAEWKLMSLQERRNTPLTAGWNSGGSYFSGFLPIKYYQKVDITSHSECIVMGTLLRIYKGITGYTLTLKETELSGSELKIWVKDATFEKGTPGNSLYAELKSIENDLKTNEGREVYAFGKFRKQQSSNNRSRSWLSLPITHPSMIWIS